MLEWLAGWVSGADKSFTKYNGIESLDSESLSSEKMFGLPYILIVIIIIMQAIT